MYQFEDWYTLTHSAMGPDKPEANVSLYLSQQILRSKFCEKVLEREQLLDNSGLSDDNIIIQQHGTQTHSMWQTVVSKCSQGRLGL